MFNRYTFAYLGKDVRANDGFYTSVLAKFPSNGLFPLKVRAVSKEGNQTKLVEYGGSATRIPIVGKLTHINNVLYLM